MGDYVNSPAEERNNAERRENCHSGASKVAVAVGVSFGLLCIIQAALNVSLRLQATESKHVNSTNITLVYVHQLQGQIKELQIQNKHQRLLMRHCEAAQPKLQDCPLGWRHFKSSCYFLSTKRNNWMNAEADCDAKDAHLVILNNEMEGVALRDFGSAVTWIGLVRPFKKWTWMDGVQLTADDRLKLLPGYQHFDCAYSDQSLPGTVMLVPADCSERHYWVCERKLK